MIGEFTHLARYSYIPLLASSPQHSPASLISTTFASLKRIEGMSNTKPTWLAAAISARPRNAVRRLNTEPNGFYACGLPQFNYNVRSSYARIRSGKLQIDVSYSGIDSALTMQEGEGLKERQWLDVSAATSFVDAYGLEIYAS